MYRVIVLYEEAPDAGVVRRARRAVQAGAELASSVTGR